MRRYLNIITLSKNTDLDFNFLKFTFRLFMRKLKNEELGRMNVDEFKESDKNSLVIILDNVRSMHNVGSVFRTADAFRIEKIYLCGITGKPPHREINKTALGATESVDWEHVVNTMDVIDQLKMDNYQIISIEQADKSLNLHDFEVSPNQKYAVVFGNEVYGVEENVVRNSDTVIEIPQFGTKHSLNISVCVGIVLWDLLTKIKSF